MPTPNAQLTTVLNNFASTYGGTSGQPYVLLTQTLNNSPALMTELNSDAQQGTLTFIKSESPTSGNGGLFDPNSDTIYLPMSQSTSGGVTTYTLVSGGSTQTASDLSFVLGHEGYHSYTAGSTSANWNTFVQQATSQGNQSGSPDDTSTLMGNLNYLANNESTANIQGWNSYVAEETALHPSLTGTALAQQMYADDPSRASAFITSQGAAVSGGPQLGSDFSVSLTLANENAEQSVWYNNVNNLGYFGNQSYPAAEAGSAVGTLVNKSQTDQLSLNFATANLTPNQLAEGLGQFTGNNTFQIKDLNTGTTYYFTTSSSGAVVTMTSSASSTPIVFVGENNGADTTGNIVTAANASVTLAQGYSASINATGDSVTMLNGSAASVAAGDTATLNCGASSATLTGQETTTCNASTLNISGTSISGSVAANSTASVNGTNDNLSLGNNTSVSLTGGSSATLTCGSQVASVTAGSSGATETCTASGLVDTSLNGGSIVLHANNNLNNTGSNDSISGSTGDTISSSGGSDTLAGGAGGDLILNGGGGTDNVSLPSGSISVGANTSSYISGSASNGSDSISVASGSSIGLLGGSGYYVVSGSGANIGTAYSAGLLLGGGSDTVSLGQGSNLGLLGGANYTVSGTSGIISTAWDASFYLGGFGNTATLASGSNIGVLGGTATVDSTSNYIGEASGAAVTVGGSGNVVSFDSSGNTLSTSASNDVGVARGFTNEVINISNSTIRVGDNAAVQINGSNDKILGGSGDTFHVSGTYDDVSADWSTIDFSGTDTGDIVDGSSDAGYGWGGYDPTGYYGYGGGYGGFGGYGFASKSAATGKNIGVIASFDAAVGDQADADRVVAARLQALDAVNGASSAGGYSPVLDGAKWRKGTITWTIDGAAGAGGVQFTNAIQSQYEKTIEDAFAVWGKATGLKFQEVSSPNADIHIGWASFAAASSGVLGYTDIRSQGGIALPGATIALEDPTDLALTAGPDGALTYEGTNATLEQVLLHEIGHALGLAADSDPSSIMNPVLSQQNQTLDSTDLKGMQELYGSSASKKVSGLADAYATQAAQMVSQMATFGAQSSGGVSTLHIPTSIGAATTLNLAVTH